MNNCDGLLFVNLIIVNNFHVRIIHAYHDFTTLSTRVNELYFSTSLMLGLVMWFAWANGMW